LWRASSAPIPASHAHAKYAHLLLERSADGAAAREIRAAVQELTGRALAVAARR
jgi:hypothetical protein